MRTRAAFWTLAAVALLLSHDAVFLVQLGPGESLAHTLRQAGHDYWGAATVALGVAGTVLAAAATWRLVRLRRRAAALQARVRPVPARTYLVRSATMAARLFAVVAVGFVLQENIEHVLNHGHAPGLGALVGPEYPLALPVIGAISLIAGMLGGIVATTARRLVACIVEALARQSRAPRSMARPHTGTSARPRSPMASRLAGRAPPLVAVAF
jgi:hypothetical protein